MFTVVGIRLVSGGEASALIGIRGEGFDYVKATETMPAPTR
jgi:hypothetical protein